MNERLGATKSSEKASSLSPTIELSHMPFSGGFGHVGNAHIKVVVTTTDNKKLFSEVSNIGGGSVETKAKIIEAFMSNFFKTHGYVPRRIENYNEIRAWAQERGLTKGKVEKHFVATEHFKARFERKSRMQRGVEEKQWQYEKRENGVRTVYALDRSEFYNEDDGKVPVEVHMTIVDKPDYKVKIVRRIRAYESK